MERKNLFDIVSAQFDLPAEVQRMDRLFTEKSTIFIDRYMGTVLISFSTKSKYTIKD